MEKYDFHQKFLSDLYLHNFLGLSNCEKKYFCMLNIERPRTLQSTITFLCTPCSVFLKDVQNCIVRSRSHSWISDLHSHEIQLDIFKTNVALKFIILQYLITTKHRKVGTSQCDHKLTELSVTCKQGLKLSRWLDVATSLETVV